MQTILLPRRVGKTTELVRMSAETSAYIVVQSKAAAAHAFAIAKHLGLDIPYPITHAEFIAEEYYGKGITGFLIDDADALLQKLARCVPILAASITNNS